MSKSNLDFVLRVITPLLIIGFCNISCSETTTSSPGVISKITEQVDSLNEATPTSIPTNTPMSAPTHTPISTSTNTPIIPSLYINPNSGPIGTKYTLELVQFTPNSLVDISIYYLDTGNLVFNSQVEVDNTGYGLTTISSGPGNPSGEYRVVASDQATGLSAESIFSIIATVPANTPTSTPANTPTSTPTNTPTSTPTNTPIPPSININPNSGPIGTEYTLELVQFTPNSLVDISIYYLDTGNLVFNSQVKVDNTGYGLTTISSGPGDPSGKYRVVASDQATGLFAESTFSVEQPARPLPPQISFDSTSIDFTPGEDTGSRERVNFVYLGSSDRSHLIIQNTGGVPLEIASYEFTSPHREDFHIGDERLDTGSTNIIGAKLNPQQSCYIVVVFEPLDIGERQANLVIRSHETGAGVAMSELTVHGFAKVNTTGFASSAGPLSSSNIPGCHQLVN